VPKAKDAPRDPVAAELAQIKGLLILLLLKSGASSDEIALATRTGASTVRRDFPAERFVPFSGARKRG
jgi:hypothetical protein